MPDAFFKDGANPGMAISPVTHTIYKQSAQMEHFGRSSSSISRHCWDDFFKTLRSVLRSRIGISRDSDRKNISVDVKESCFDEDRFVFVVSPFLLNTMNLKQ